MKELSIVFIKKSYEGLYWFIPLIPIEHKEGVNDKKKDLHKNTQTLERTSLRKVLLDEDNEYRVYT